MVHAVHALLDAGADALCVDNHGRTPLHWFCTLASPFDDSHRKAFTALVARAPAAISMADKLGDKPIHLAMKAYGSHSRLSAFALRHLIGAGADISDPGSAMWVSALHMIAPRLVGYRELAAEAATLFQEAAAIIDINTPHKGTGETPIFRLVTAAWEDAELGDHTLANRVIDADVLPMFVDLGADLMATDAKG
jgi:hypothetical protein